MHQTSSWTDADRWNGRWNVIETLAGGGQGEAFRAVRLSDGQTGFLKTIKSKKDLERRARFFREASAYDTFRIDGIPRLIESNAHRHQDLAAAPYIVTTFVEGPTLEDWRANQGEVPWEIAVAATRRLLHILGACHEAGCTHRDIKPRNIILEGGDPGRPWLLDFGLSWHELSEAGFETECGQEVGNRFLRLPELSAGSRLKQDPRSDLSFAAGILFNLLTGDHPDLLQDAEGRLPHQRSSSLAQLQRAAGPRFARLAAWFDTAFAPLLSERFSNVAAMRDALDRVMADPLSGGSADDDLAAILEALDTGAERRRNATISRFRDALHHAHELFAEIDRVIGDRLVRHQTDYGLEGSSGRTTHFWTRPASSEKLVVARFEVREAGAELVILPSGEPVFRTPFDREDLRDGMREAIRPWVLGRLRAALADPRALPGEADAFMEVRPFSSLEEATAAASDGRSILAFVYDPTMPERSQLHYGLTHFLANRKTRDAMNAAFVTALVPTTDVAAHSPILEGQSMERARWIVFDGRLAVLEQAVVYPNGEEGERIMTALARRFGPERFGASD